MYNQSKKIAVISHYGGIGGGTKSLINLLNILANEKKIDVYINNIEPEVYTRLSSMPGVNVFNITSVPIIPLYSGGGSTFSPRLYFQIIKSFFKIRELTKMVDKYNYDLLIVNSITVCWASFFMDKIEKKICFVRETKKNSIYNHIQKKMLEKFTKVIFLSHYDERCWNLSNSTVIENTFDELNSINSNYIKLSNPINPNESKKHGGEKNNCATERVIKFLYLGGDSYIKGFYNLLAASYFLRKNKQFKIVLLGKVNRKINKFLIKKFFSDLIINEGLVMDASEFYLECDIVVFPVTKPHQGRPIIEAGYFNKPVIAPELDCFMEFVTDGVNGFYYKPGSVNELKRVMSACIDTPEKLVNAGIENRKIYDAKHSSQLYKLKIKNLINQLF